MAEFDLVVRGGNLADGTGAALREADVAVKDGRIAAVGKVSGKSGWHLFWHSAETRALPAPK